MRNVLAWFHTVSSREALSWLVVVLMAELQTDRILRSYGYQLVGNGRWQSMTLKKLKKAAKGGKRKAAAVQQGGSDEDDDGIKTQEVKNTKVNFHSCGWCRILR